MDYVQTKHFHEIWDKMREEVFREGRRPVHPYMRGFRHRSIFEPWVTDADLPHDGEYFQQYVAPLPWVTHYNENDPIDKMIETKTITREEMKRKLSGEQFMRRLTPPRPQELEAMLGYYVRDVERHNDNEVLTTEIPLRLTEIHNQRGDREHVALVLAGYRIYKVKRSDPGKPELLAAYSKLTRKWHRIGFADGMAGLLGGRSLYTCDGCYSLGEWVPEPGPRSLDDELVRLSLLVDTASDHGVSAYGLRNVVKRRCPYSLQSLGGCIEVEAKGLPPHLLLLRYLRSKPEAFTKMLALVDQYGMPGGILGEVFAHHDKFRTL